MRPIGVSEIEESLEWLDLYERTEITQSELAEILGFSQGHLSRRLSLARRYRQEQRREQGVGSDDERSEVGDDEATWLELVDRPSMESGHGFYDLATDSTSADGTGAFVFIGTGRGGPPRRNRLGTGRHVDSGQSYRSKDDGLKGGKG